MSAVKKGEQETGDAQVHKIRMTLNSQQTDNIEKVCRDLIAQAKQKKIKVTGPVRLPTKTLKLHTRKTPNGEGSKTWDRYEMRIHKRIIDLHTSSAVLRQILNINIETGVQVDVTILNN
eukprot:m.40830 g.40830  ORF g.40830 m.40830 type:complete len:119 (+) comp14865_c0_seq1:199-555(+)